MKFAPEICVADDVVFGGNRPFVLIAGPCMIESEKTTLETAEALWRICDDLNIKLVFKASFDKANRSSLHGARGVEMKEGLRILGKVREEWGVPVTTDVHESWQCEPAGELVDIIQIPAFLARQTDLLLAAARTGRVVNIKKAQFMAPSDIQNAVEKVVGAGNDRVLVCERGTMFGYHRLVVDMAGLVEMRQVGKPIVFDATHSTQRPGALGTSSGGDWTLAPILMRAALAVGVDAIFAETHPCPENALSDAQSQIPLSKMENILKIAQEFDVVAKKICDSQEEFCAD
ncbi:MAG: 3-deoxy-8-phosphooctulonate synthase [Planctomycetia bacterium]|nr:3-deoxy-8-phosphooctulonate synthase [Planctomycetia bacterium]